MNDLEWLKVFGVNGTVFATVSLSDIELVLKIVLLIMTCIWTGVKIVKLLKEE